MSYSKNYTVLPEDKRWIRLPVGQEVEPHCGLRRTALANLVKRSKGKIRQVSLRQPGLRRGNRLIWLPSLMEYLHELANEQSGTEQETGLSEEQLEALPADIHRTA